MLQLGSPWVLLFVPVAVWFVLWGQRVSYVNLSVGRRRLAIGLRLALMGVITLALSGPVVRTRSAAPPLVALVDVSRSITPRMLETERQLIDQVWRGRGAVPFEVMTYAGHPRHAPIIDGRPHIERHD